MLNFLISSEEDNQTIISFIKRRFKTTPISLIYKLFRIKKIQINQQNCRYYHYRLKEGDKITIKDKWLQTSLLSNSLPLLPDLSISVTYEDQNVLLVIKEHNQEIYKPNDRNCLDNQVQYYLYQQDPEKYQEQRGRFFVPVALHRLDKLTRGLVIYSKNARAKKIIYNSIHNKNKITKSYLAICENYQRISIPSFIKGWISKDELNQKMKFSYQRPVDHSKHCTLTVQKLFQQGIYQLYKVTLETGRKHQIRAIFSFFQLPIIGDWKYGSKIKVDNKIYLFAYQLAFDDLSSPLGYLNGKTFQMENLEKELTLLIKSWVKNKKPRTTCKILLNNATK